METLIYIAKASALLGVFLLLYQFLFRKESFLQVNRFYLLAGLLLSFSLPLVSFTQIEWIKVEVPAEQPVNYSVIDFEKAVTTSTEIPIVQQQEALYKDYITWSNCLLALYGLGVLFFFGKLIHQTKSLFHLLRQANKFKENGIWHYETNQSVETFSFFNLMVYNPKLYDKKELVLIKTHEEAHIKGWHSVDMLLANLANVLLWFLPISFWYRKAIDENCEYIADAKTVQKTKLAKQYQYTLVNHLALNTKMNYASYFFKQSSLKNRIIMMNKAKSSKYKLINYSFTLPLIIGFIWFFQTETVAKELYVEVETPTQTDISEKPADIQNTLSKVSFQETDGKIVQQDSTSMTSIDNIEAKINKDASDESLENLAEFFAEQDQKLKFSRIKRNKNGEITRIKILISDAENGIKKELAVSGNEPIGEYVIQRNFKKNTAEITEWQEPKKNIYSLLNEAKVIIVNGKEYDKDSPLAITDIVVERIENNEIELSAKELSETDIEKIYKIYEGEDGKREIFILKDSEGNSDKEVSVMRLEVNKNKNFEEEFAKAHKAYDDASIKEIEITFYAELSEESKSQLKEYFKNSSTITLNKKQFEPAKHKGKIILLENFKFEKGKLDLIGSLEDYDLEELLNDNAFQDKMADFIQINKDGKLQLVKFGKPRKFYVHELINGDKTNQYKKTEKNSTDLTSKREQIEKLYRNSDFVFIDGKKKTKAELIDKVLLFETVSFEENELHFNNAEIRANKEKNIANILGNMIKEKEEITNMQVLWFKNESKVELAAIHKSSFKNNEPETSISYLSNKKDADKKSKVKMIEISVDSTYFYDGKENARLIDGLVELRYNHDTQPIFVVDGKVVDNESFKEIQPTAIKSINVFKNYDQLPDEIKNINGVKKEEFHGLIVIELKDKNDKNKFEIIVSKTKKGYTMQCNEGCAWKELSFSLNRFTSQYINAYGVSSKFSENEEDFNGLADFQFKVEEKKDLLQLTKLTGTNWEELSFKINENENYTLTPNGIFKND